MSESQAPTPQQQPRVPAQASAADPTRMVSQPPANPRPGTVGTAGATEVTRQVNPMAANPAAANPAAANPAQQMTSAQQAAMAAQRQAAAAAAQRQAAAAAGQQRPPGVPPGTAPGAGHRPAAPPPMAQMAAPVETLPPGQPTMAQIVREAFDKGYSDIHVGVGELPRFRDRGQIAITSYPETDKVTFMCWLREFMSNEEIARFERDLDFDGATQYEFARVRVNVFDSLRGPALVMRLIPIKILTMEQLNLPPVFRDICHYHKGLILVTGPTGSGKSTTMAAMVDYINTEMPKHIITIEDPIEFVHKSKKALIKQREIGINSHKFDAALKASLREDPDIILIGEMRDRETVNTAMKAAQTGHLVMGTLHTNSAVKTIERILNLYEPTEQEPVRIAFAESLVGIIAQGLCRTTDGKRAAFHEIMLNTDAIRDYIRRGEIDEVEAIIPRCGFDGMCTMNQSLYTLYEEGRITEETALEMSSKPNEMAQMLRGRV
jgi:twitching motility protein PilT